MSIDSAEKRRSAIGAFLMPINPTVTPNSSKDSEWRAEALWLYSGVAPAAAAATPHGAYFTRTVGRLIN
jgi:hypothetical protein